jgi:predicted NBD/HSP70 family sugar kinase
MGNDRPCGCGAVGCLETLASTGGLLASFTEAHPRRGASWTTLLDSIASSGIEPWLARTLDATAGGIAGALNVIGLRHVVLTGSLAELSPLVVQHLSAAIERGAMWARFGKIEVEAAPRRRTAGLVAVGIDRLVLPMASRTSRQES